MGLYSSARRCAGARSNPQAIAPNPNPGNYQIKGEWKIGNFLVLLVYYPDCTNFEGKKLLVYEGWENSQLLLKHNLYQLDPHFENKVGAPIARFRPTEKSFELIERMAGMHE